MERRPKVKRGDKLRLLENLTVSHPTLGEVVVTTEDELVFLHKDNNKYTACIKKFHGTGTSGVILRRKDFIIL